jgi:hypothetical protein
MSTKKSFEYLSGPVSWYEYEFKDDQGNKKMIHLFGDRHDLKTICDDSLKCMKNANSPKSNCYDFVYFLKELFDMVVHNQQYADFFLEFRYNIYKKNTNKSYQDTMIGKVYSQFQECLQYTKKDCKYLPYVRMHYTDLRDVFIEQESEGNKILGSFTDLLFYGLYNEMIEDFSSTLFKQFPLLSEEKRLKTINMIDVILSMLKDYCKFYKILFLSKNFVEDLNDFIQPVFEIFETHAEEFEREDVKHFVKIFESLKKLKHPKSKSSILGYQLSELEKDNIMVNGKNISDLIFPFIDKKCNLIMKIYPGIVNQWKKFSNEIIALKTPIELQPLFYPLLDFKKELQTFVVLLNAYILDGYILSRLFRSFSTSGKKHEPSILSIVYAGNVHIETEVEFFNEILKLTPIHQITPNTGDVMKKSQCLYSKYFQDIFSPFDQIPSKGKEEYFSEIINQKNFEFLSQDVNGILLKAKKLGPFCELLPELDICSEEEGENVEDYYIWIDKKNHKFAFNFKEDIYRDEDNEILESEQINELREISVIHKLFQDKEYELLNPSSSSLRKKYENIPTLFANILFNYAQNVIGGRWKEAEEYILKSPEKTVDYAIYVLKKRWPNETLKTGENLREKAEDIIRNSKYSEKYDNKFGLN